MFVEPISFLTYLYLKNHEGNSLIIYKVYFTAISLYFYLFFGDFLSQANMPSTLCSAFDK